MDYWDLDRQCVRVGVVDTTLCFGNQQDGKNAAGTATSPIRRVFAPVDMSTPAHTHTHTRTDKDTYDLNLSTADTPVRRIRDNYIAHEQYIIKKFEENHQLRDLETVQWLWPIVHTDDIEEQNNSFQLSSTMLKGFTFFNRVRNRCTIITKIVFKFVNEGYILEHMFGNKGAVHIRRSWKDIVTYGYEKTELYPLCITLLELTTKTSQSFVELEKASKLTLQQWFLDCSAAGKGHAVSNPAQARILLQHFYTNYGKGVRVYWIAQRIKADPEFVAETEKQLETFNVKRKERKTPLDMSVMFFVNAFEVFCVENTADAIYRYMKKESEEEEKEEKEKGEEEE